LRSRSRPAFPWRGNRAGDETGPQRRHPFPLRAGRFGGDALLNWAAVAAEYVVFWLILPLLLLHPRVRQGIRVRFGFYDPAPSLREGPRIWLHGASAGDVLGLVPIVKELKALRPDARIIVSAITDSGASMARQRLVAQGLADLATFLPYDLPGACRRAIAALRPDVLVLEYTELWPQLIAAASEAQVRLALTNGRLRPRNVPRYRILFRLAGNLLERFDVLMMRAEDEAERARVLGLARSLGLRARLRSEPGGPEPVIVLDTIGELVRAYQLATVVFVGGSFGRRGGQNILEPAACGKPVLFGPRMENFQDSVQVLVGRGGLQVKDPVALLRLMRDLLARPEEIRKLGELAREAVSSVRGA